MLASIFELYAQVNPARSRAEGGLGIGLTLARRVVELHGGTLEATSEGLGLGSEFVMRLPLTPNAELPTSSQSPEVVEREVLPTRRILVVDDNPDSAASLVMLLRLLGHEVREAYDGQGALAILEQFVPNLVLLDLGMPGLSGYDVAAQIRSQPRLNRVRIVALSGYGGPEDRGARKPPGFTRTSSNRSNSPRSSPSLHRSGRAAMRRTEADEPVRYNARAFSLDSGM